MSIRVVAVTRSGGFFAGALILILWLEEELANRSTIKAEIAAT